MSKRVSIIMPVYNVERYLPQAMESAVNQEYDNYEVICIDDGSTDKSGDILELYTKYKFVKVIHKKNTGYGNSMNLGLDMSTGSYVSILEPDDYIEKDMLASLMKVIEIKGELDFVKSNFLRIKGESNLEITPTPIIKDKNLFGRVLEGEEIRQLYLGQIAHWTSIYNLEFLNKNSIRYNETPGASYQDTGFWFQTLMHGEHVYLLDRYFYHYRIDNLESSMNNRGKIYCAGTEYDYIEKKVDQFFDSREIYPYYVKCRFLSVKSTYSRIADRYRKDFLLKTQEDFVRIQKEGKLDLKYFDKDEKELLDGIMAEPVKLWENMQAACVRLHQKIALKNCFYIYGAGEMAKLIYRLLDEGERHKLAGFVVTYSSDVGNGKMGDVPVLSFDDVCCNADATDAFWVVGVSKLYSSAIAERLKKKEIQNYIIFEGGIV